jgi:hypothetical protein
MLRAPDPHTNIQQGASIMALVVIGSFVVLFLGAILWATRRPADEHHH